MTIAYFDCFNGAAGDMIVAALVDAGTDVDRLQAGLASLGLDGYTLSIEKVTKQGFAATRFHVALEEKGKQPHRHLAHVVEIIERSKLSAPVKEKSIRVFRRLAEAEAKVHGTTIEKVHFHEVGAVDAILDITGAVLGLELLGAERIVCSPIPVGSGTVRCEHGIMPIPAPATAELLAGVPIAATNEPGELTTPTGAAILTTLAESFGAIPAMSLSSVGYGAGSRDGQTRPNVLRLMIGTLTETNEDTDEIAVLETNLDDTTPEIVGYCLERLLNAGALDVFAVPIQMKKSRVGVLLTVLCEVTRAGEFEQLLFAETTTLGIRRHHVRRVKMRRRQESVETEFGPVLMKVGERNGVCTASPEFEDCRRIALERHVALRDVMGAANAAWAQNKPNA